MILNYNCTSLIDVRNRVKKYSKALPKELKKES